MTDKECVDFLQWALPRLRMRWPGFRKVRSQVCKRIHRRSCELGIDSPAAYRELLEAQPAEWAVLDAMCRISVSRFWRDRGVFAFLEATVLPTLAARVVGRGDDRIAAWSAGCGSGEEPYSLAIMWNLALRERFFGLQLAVLATDASPVMLDRARVARYAPSSLKELPEPWRQEAFERTGGQYRLQDSCRALVEFRLEDLRTAMPEGPFDLILCRNLAFTYFEKGLQEQVLDGLVGRLRTGGALVIGSHEHFPGEKRELIPRSGQPGIFEKEGEV